MDETHDSVDDLVDKLAPKPGPWDAMFRELDVEPTTPGEWRGRIGPGRTLHRGDPNGELNAWGLYRADVERHYRTAVVVRVPRRELRRPFRWIRDWWRGGAIVALFLAILLVGGVR